MGFTQDEAEAKIGKRVRVRDGSLSLYGIAKGTTGEVVDCELAGICQMGVGPGSTIGGKKEEGWAVVVQFDVRHDESTYPIEKDHYDHSLEEI